MRMCMYVPYPYDSTGTVFVSTLYRYRCTIPEGSLSSRSRLRK
jgi:hypothetical protein